MTILQPGRSAFTMTNTTDAEPAPWFALVQRRVAARIRPKWLRLPVMLAVVLAVIPVVWLSLVLPLLSISTTSEWLIRNSSRLDRTPLAAVALAVCATVWCIGMGVVVGWTAARRTGRIDLAPATTTTASSTQDPS